MQIPSVAHVIVAPFDLQAAQFLAEKLPEEVIHNEMRADLFVDYLRYDALILSCAARFNATLVTLEASLHNLAAAAGVPSRQVKDFGAARVGRLDLRLRRSSGPTPSRILSAAGRQPCRLRR